jgi:predicted DCC family thiol-disulfide oxidoreductase YuxK
MNGQLTVLYDGDCGICSHTARLLVRIDSRRRLQLVALQTATVPGMPPRNDLMRELHAVDRGGYWFVGASAAVEIARRVPLLWPITLVARFPLAMPILDALYRAVADNRHSLSRALGLQVCQVRNRQV